MGNSLFEKYKKKSKARWNDLNIIESQKIKTDLNKLFQLFPKDFLY
jgi:hypothetical protein